jgi:hypothetical protein
MPLWDNVNCNRSLGFLDMYKGDVMAALVLT